MMAIDQGGGGYTPEDQRFPKTKLASKHGDTDVCKFVVQTSIKVRLSGRSRLKYAREVAIAALLLPAVALGLAQTPTDAIALEQQQKWAEAAQVWKVVTARNPTDAAAFAALGIDLARQQEYDEAAAAYHKALKLNPKLPGVELNLGLAEFKQGHFS